MLKTLLLASSILVAAPAVAQEAPAQDTMQTAPQSTAPQQTDAPTTASEAATGTQGAGTVDAATPDAAAPADAASTAPAADTVQPSATEPAAAPAATVDQVSQAVTRDFGNYDKDSNGALNQDEFGMWMVTLRKAAEPAFAPGSPEAQTWVGQAFAATDTDKNQSVSKEELTVFLTPKAQ
ncbi:hypothetical protein ACG3SL_02340 [Sphingomonas sp. CJ20]